MYLINDFNAIKIISMSKVNQAWANACSIDVKQCKEPKYIQFGGTLVEKNGEIREIRGKMYLINDFSAIEIISKFKVNQAWANASSIDGKQFNELNYIKIGGTLVEKMGKFER